MNSNFCKRLFFFIFLILSLSVISNADEATSIQNRTTCIDDYSILFVASSEKSGKKTEDNSTIKISTGTIMEVFLTSQKNKTVTAVMEDGTTIYISQDNLTPIIGTYDDAKTYSEQVIAEAEKAELLRKQEEAKAKAAEANKGKIRKKVDNVADYVWNYLKKQGYNDYVCAGIIGNMMVECGGQTFNLDPYCQYYQYYGLCQWSKGRCDGADIDEQLAYLCKTIKSEFKTYGKLSGYTYEEFCALTDERKAALAFAKTYERCGTGGYQRRQNCATKALNRYHGG